MHYSYLYIVDADQYPLSKIFEWEDIVDDFLISAANSKDKIMINGSLCGVVVPLIPEAADINLITQLEKFQRTHSANAIIIATRDKRLLSMLLYRIYDLTFNGEVMMHSCCSLEMDSTLYEINKILNVYYACKNLIKINIKNNDNELMMHIKYYPLGLRLKTLTHHYHCSVEKMRSRIQKLVNRGLIYKSNNVYYCN